jgi:hypothetical protein
MLLAALLAVLGGMESSAYVRPGPVAQFTARSMEFVSPARLQFRRVDVVITEWSTGPEHRELVRALADKGSAAFFNVLCGYTSRGTVSVASEPTFTIRYAWQVADAAGGRRVFVATDEPMFVGNIRDGRPYNEPLVFLELRVDRTGHGIGTLSEVDQLIANQSRDVIELRDFEGQPADLIVEESH